MEFNNDNNKREQVNVNTRGAVFMNSESNVNQSTLVTGFWNNMLSLKLHPTLPADKQTDYRKFDYDQVINTALTETKTAALLEIAKDAYKNLVANENFSRGLSVGGNGLVSINVVNVAEGVTYACLLIARDIDEHTRQSKNFNIYVFKDEQTIDEYNVESGEFKAGQAVHSELLRFISVLEASLHELTNAGVHSYRHVEKFYKDKLMNTLTAVADKNGVDVGSTFNRGGNSGGGSSNFWKKDEDKREKVGVEHSNPDELAGLM